MSRATRWLSVIPVVAVWAVDARPAAACTPPPGGLPTYGVCDRARAADVVVLGVVRSVHGAERPPYSAQIQVEEYLKATGPVSITISGFGPSGLCLSEVGVDDRRIFFADGDPNADPKLRAHYLSQFDAVMPPDPPDVALLRTGCIDTATPTADPNAPIEVELWLPRLLVRRSLNDADLDASVERERPTRWALPYG